MAYLRKLFNIQQSPRVQPTVVSPLILRQLKIRSNEKLLPSTKAVKIMSTVAHM